MRGDFLLLINLIIGAGTEVIAGEGLIVTAGGLDTHIHFISPTQVDAFFPIGAFTLSNGLEDYVMRNKIKRKKT